MTMGKHLQLRHEKNLAGIFSSPLFSAYSHAGIIIIIMDISMVHDP